MPISFNSIPVNLLVPGTYIEFDNSKAVLGVPPMPNKILVLGQKLAAGSAGANVPVLVPSPDDAVALFGRGSMLARMIAAAKKANPFTELWAIGLADNVAGVAATGSVAFTAAATQAGTFNLYIGGTLVQIGVATTQTVDQLATALAAAINDDADLPVTAAVDGVTTSKVNITARHKGLCGNDVDLRVNYNAGDALPAGLTVAIVAMANGTTAPDLTAAIAATGDTWYNHFIHPYTDAASTTAIAAELDRRVGPLVMKEGAAWSAAAGSLGTLNTLGDGLNSMEHRIIGTGASPTEPCIWAAVFGAVAAYYLAIDPARPLQTLQLVGVLPPAAKDRFIQSERNQLLESGIATYVVDDGGNVLIERAVTTYKTNAQGLPDPSYRDAETLATLFFLRYAVRTRISQRFPRFKLANDGTRFGAGQAIVTPSVIKGELIALFSEWVDAGLVEDIDQFKRDLIVERDANDVNRVNALIPPNVVNQFRVFAGKVQFIL